MLLSAADFLGKRDLSGKTNRSTASPLPAGPFCPTSPIASVIFLPFEFPRIEFSGSSLSEKSCSTQFMKLDNTPTSKQRSNLYAQTPIKGF